MQSQAHAAADVSDATVHVVPFPTLRRAVAAALRSADRAAVVSGGRTSGPADRTAILALAVEAAFRRTADRGGGGAAPDVDAEAVGGAAASAPHRGARTAAPGIGEEAQTSGELREWARVEQAVRAEMRARGQDLLEREASRVATGWMDHALHQGAIVAEALLALRCAGMPPQRRSALASALVVEWSDVLVAGLGRRLQLGSDDATRTAVAVAAGTLAVADATDPRRVGLALGIEDTPALMADSALFADGLRHGWATMLRALETVGAWETPPSRDASARRSRGAPTRGAGTGTPRSAGVVAGWRELVHAFGSVGAAQRALAASDAASADAAHAHRMRLLPATVARVEAWRNRAAREEEWCRAAMQHDGSVDGVVARAISVGAPVGLVLAHALDRGPVGERGEDEGAKRHVLGVALAAARRFGAGDDEHDALGRAGDRPGPAEGMGHVPAGDGASGRREGSFDDGGQAARVRRLARQEWLTLEALRDVDGELPRGTLTHYADLPYTRYTALTPGALAAVLGHPAVGRALTRLPGGRPPEQVEAAPRAAWGTEIPGHDRAARRLPSPAHDEHAGALGRLTRAWADGPWDAGEAGGRPRAGAEATAKARGGRPEPSAGAVGDGGEPRMRGGLGLGVG